MEETKPMTKYEVGQTYDFTLNSVRYNFCELVSSQGIGRRDVPSARCP